MTKTRLIIESSIAKAAYESPNHPSMLSRASAGIHYWTVYAESDEEAQEVQEYYKEQYIFSSTYRVDMYNPSLDCPVLLIYPSPIIWGGNVIPEVSDIKEVSAKVAEKFYRNGLRIPTIVTFGESLGEFKHVHRKNVVSLLSLPQYSIEDFFQNNNWERFPKSSEEASLIKYGNYETVVTTDMVNSTDHDHFLRRENVNNTLMVDDLGNKYIWFQRATFDTSSSLYRIMRTKKFWEDFVFAQLLDGNSPDTFFEGIHNSLFIARIFAEKLVEKERHEIVLLEDRINDRRIEINSQITYVSRLNIQNREDESTLVYKKRNVTNTSALSNKILTELRILKENKLVESVDLVGKVVFINTHPILVDNVVPIGGYRIHLNIEANTINIENTENPQRDYDHPHVNCTTPCWGNYTDVYTHLSDLELSTVFELIVRFLSSWNPHDSWGKNLIMWDAKYAFDTLKEMELLDTVPSEWADEYYDVYGESLALTCSYCGCREEDCYCYCPRCGDLKDGECGCNWCPECRELHERNYRNCDCDRCEYCEELEDYCTCERCAYCDEKEEECICDICQFCDEKAAACVCERCEVCESVKEMCTCQEESNEQVQA
jgi:protocadherin alpha